MDLNTKKPFPIISEFLVLRGATRKIVKSWIFKGSSVQNSQFSVILEFSTLKMMMMRKIAKFRKIGILEHNLAANYFTMKKFHMRRLDLYAKKQFSAISKFSILKD